jgi:septum formation protein
MRRFLEHLNGYRIFLGSRSPRRQKLLTQLGLPYQVWLKEEVPEEYPVGLSPDEVALFLARLKAKPYADELAGSDILITADTIVVVDEKILGKPTDREDAISMLSNLSNRPHEVISGVCLTSAVKESAFIASTRVWFDRLDPSEIREYVDEFKPFDKAGAYGIQEWIGFIGIHRIEGSYFNVMGLPIQRLYKELQRFTDYSLNK